MNQLNESRANLIKETIKEYLIDQGYGTYARRLNDYKFVIADVYHGIYIDVAAMFPDFAEIVINPSMVDASTMRVAGDSRDDQEKLLAQLSVLIRHELLHFLLVHQQRLLDHLAQKDPNWKTLYNQRIANYAMDYEISLKGYDAEDKQVVKLMTLNNQVVGGLLADDEKVASKWGPSPDWKNLTMEKMYDILHAEHLSNLAKRPSSQNKPTITIEKTTHSNDYTDMYNKIMASFDKSTIADEDLDLLLARAQRGDSLYDLNTGYTLIGEGE